MEMHGFHGIRCSPWNSRTASVEVHAANGNNLESSAYHGIVWYPENTIDSMELHKIPWNQLQRNFIFLKKRLHSPKEWPLPTVA